MIRYLTRRLQRLETRAKEIAEARPLAHVICFVDANKRVVSSYDMGTREWTRIDPNDPPQYWSDIPKGGRKADIVP